MAQIAEKNGVAHAARIGGGRCSILGRIRCACLAGAMLALTVSGVPALAQSKADLEISEKGGFSRLIFSFSAMPKFKIDATDSVLIIAFDRPIDVGEALKQLRDLRYLVAGRVDPDGKTVRFALSQKLRANSIEAGDKLFIDLLPETWRGPPPSLPQSVIADLAARAKLAEVQAEREAKLKAVEDEKRIVKVRIGEHPTFSRLSFEWPQPPTAQLARAGNVITVSFDKLAKPLMGRLKADPPKYVRSADFEQGEDGLIITLNIDPVMDVRAFREGNSYVVDVSDPFGLAYANDIAKKLAGAVAPGPGRPEPVTEIKADRDPSVVPAALKSDKGSETRKSSGADKEKMVSAEPIAAPKADAAKKPAPKADAPKKPVADRADSKPTSRAEASKSEPKGADDQTVSKVVEQTQSVRETELGYEVPTIVISEKPLDFNGLAAVDDKRTASLDSVVPSPKEPMLRPADAKAPDTLDPDQEAPKPAAEDPLAPSASAGPDSGKVAAKTPASSAASSKGAKPMPAMGGKTAPTNRMVLHEFTFSRPVAAAILVRADALWLRFDTDERVDVAALSKRSPDLFGKPQAVRAGDKEFFRVPLKDELKIVAWANGNSWAIGLDDGKTVRDEAVELVKGVRTDGLLKVTAKVSNIGTVSLLRDPVIGDKIFLATAYGIAPTRTEGRRFVEFATLPTAIGLAVKPYTDDLAVRIVDGELMITRRGGLTLSSGDDGLSSKQTFDQQNSLLTGTIDVASWSASNNSDVHNRIANLEQGIASLPAFQAVGLRMELTHHYLGNRLAAEALGQIRLMVETDPDIADKPAIHAMRAIANSMLHRPHDARRDMKKRDVGMLPSMVLWRAVMEAQSENWSEAANAFRIADAEISKYPEEMQALFRLLFATAAIETGDWVTADLQLKAAPIRSLSPSQDAERVMLRGRMLEGLGRNEEAMAAYDFAIESRDRKAEAAATFYRTRLGQKLKKLPDDAAIQRYETAAVMWRGDSLELRVLQNLAKLYIKSGEFRRGFETMKTAVTNFPRTKISSIIHDEMNEVFRDLYLDGKADMMAPIKALSLYYDYRELTPVGRLGDEMIRKLADRLINVDLLDKAAEVLAHQVEKRLTGAARAQVAAKLATVYLLDRKPEKALQVLRRTRQAVLPRELLRQRRLLEARSLSELGRHQQAIDLISNFNGTDIERTRAETYWKNERWQDAGEAFELMLSDLENTTSPLTDAQRIDILKAAIAYSLADDVVGLRRFREKYAVRMASSMDANAFEVLTNSVDKQSVEFQNLAREIASINSLEGFLSDFRKSLDALDGENTENQSAS